jgi:NAD(P)H-dependent FMN reductase
VSDVVRCWQALEAVRRAYNDHLLFCRYCGHGDARCAEHARLIFDAMKAEAMFEQAIPEGMRA